jgi:hypothetical protein
MSLKELQVVVLLVFRKCLLFYGAQYPVLIVCFVIAKELTGLLIYAFVLLFIFCTLKKSSIKTGVFTMCSYFSWLPLRWRINLGTIGIYKKKVSSIIFLFFKREWIKYYKMYSRIYGLIGFFV